MMTEPAEELISIARVLGLTRIKRSRLSQLVRLGLFPRPARESHRMWSEREVIEWLAAHRSLTEADRAATELPGRASGGVRKS